jgi:hypothetical protein
MASPQNNVEIFLTHSFLLRWSTGGPAGRARHRLSSRQRVAHEPPVSIICCCITRNRHSSFFSENMMIVLLSAI